MPASRRTHHRPVLLAIAALALIASGIDHAPPPANPALAPVPRDDSWLELHRRFVARAGRGDVGLLFLGDSIVSYWSYSAPAIWDRHYAPRKAVNFGIGADHIQHLLWRLDHGELEGIRPKVVVLMIGTNNVPHETEDQVVEGVKTVVNRLRRKLPDSKILLLGLTPRGFHHNASRPTASPDARIAPINRKLAGLAEAPRITYLDFGPALLDGQGQLIQAIEPDFLHLSPEGYRIWADAMEPVLRQLMAEN